jgi:hypothetical protein
MRKVYVRLFGKLTEIRTGDLSNTVLERYHRINLLRKKEIRRKVKEGRSKERYKETGKKERKEAPVCFLNRDTAQSECFCKLFFFYLH